MEREEQFQNTNTPKNLMNFGFMWSGFSGEIALYKYTVCYMICSGVRIKISVPNFAVYPLKILDPKQMYDSLFLTLS